MLAKDTLRLITKTFNRFFSLLMIVLIGAGFMMGLLSTREIMELSVDNYDDEYRLQDVQVYSTYGFDEEDASALKSQEFVGDFFASRMVDVLSEAGDGAVAVTRVEEVERDVNKYELVEGRLPEKADEMLVLETGMTSEHYQIGGKLKFFLEDENLKKKLKNTSYTIVGKVKTPAYMSNSRGTSTLKNMNLQLVAYVPKENFIFDYYTTMYFTAKGARKLASFSEEYTDFMQDVIGEMEFFAKDQQEHLKSSILAENTEKIKEGEAELEKQKAEGEKKLEEAREQLEEAKMKIVAGESQVGSLQTVLDEATARQRSLVGKYSSDAAKSVARVNQIVRDDKEGRSFDEIYTQLVTDYGTYEAMQSLAESLDGKSFEDSLNEAEEKAGELKQELDRLEKELNERLDELESIETPTIKVPDPEDAQQDVPEVVIPEVEIPEVDLSDIVIPDLDIPESEVPEAAKALLDGARNALNEARGALEKAAEGTPEEGIALLASATDGIRRAKEQIDSALADPNLDDGSRMILEIVKPELDDAISHMEDAQGTMEKAAADYAAQIQEAERKAREAEEAAKAAQEAAAKETEVPIVDEETRERLLERIAELRAQIDEYRGELNVYESLAETYRDLKEQALSQMDTPEQQIEELDKKYGGDIAATFKEYTKLQQDRLVNEALTMEMEAANKVISDAQAEIDAAKAEVEAGKIALEEGEQELRRNEIQFQLEIEKAEAEIKKAYQQIEELPEAQWTLLDRESHYPSYMYKNNAAQMGAIGVSLPVLFYLVAALVCMTTMTRLVDEQRGQIGVLRALGFSKFKITMKYVIYALFAALVGCGIGIVIGMGLFPTVIYTTWRLMYDLPEMAFHVPIKNLIICILSFAAVMSIVTAVVVGKNLKEAPSDLMRPKAPKNAKKVFLENIHALWWRLSFTSKITARNLIRYKSRFIMTVIGVAGCTGLLIVGWGIKDSIADIVAVQYGEIFNFNHSVNLEEEADVDKFVEVISEDLENEYVVPSLSYVSKVYVNKDEPTISVNVGDARMMNEVYLLRSSRTGEQIKIRNSGVIISEKFALNNDIKVGDHITIESRYGLKGEVRVDEICEMYFRHYLYMSREAYESLFGEDMKANTILVKNESGDTFRPLIEKMEGFESVVDFSPVIEQFNNMIKALDFIILVIIMTAGALAFVVLVNLTQVNISERVREIATLKVLGFRTREVNSYIFKEVFLLSVIGGLVGIPLGIVEHRFIMNVINMDMIMFGQNIKLMSFVYAYGLTLAFTLIVLFFTRKSLRKIAMVESLKSVE